jgi:hypothetical protein
MPGADGMAQTMMSERHKHTEFLKHCLGYDDSSDRHALHHKLCRIQHDMRIVKRAILLLALVFALAVAGLTGLAIFLKASPTGGQKLIVNLLYALVAGSMLSIAVFLGLWILYRRKLHWWREESRQFVKRLLAARLGDAGQHPVTPFPKQKPRLPRG